MKKKYPATKMMALATDILKTGSFKKQDVLLESPLYPLVAAHFIREGVERSGACPLDRMAKQISGRLNHLKKFVSSGKTQSILQPFLYAWKEDPVAYLEYIVENYSFDKSFLFEDNEFRPHQKQTKRFVILTQAPLIAHLIYKKVTMKALARALDVRYYVLHGSMRHYNCLPGNFIRMHRKNATGKDICTRPGCMNEKAPGNRFLCMSCYKGASEFGCDDEEHRVSPDSGDYLAGLF